MNLVPYLESLPPAAHKYVQDDLDGLQKLMVTQGLVPLPPNQLAAIAVRWLNDSNQEVQEASRTTLLDIPENLMVGILKSTKITELLTFFAELAPANDAYLEQIILNPNSSDECLMRLAATVSEAHANLLANNQVRLLKNPMIAENLKKNPHTLRSVIDTMASFLRINGIILEGESNELSDSEIKELLSMQDASFDLPPELLTDVPEEQITEEQRKSIYQLIQGLNVAKKIKLALTGNKEARSILVKDKNKVVSTSVVKSPKITDMEIMNICNLKTINDEVIRLITLKNEWTRHYSVQVALANNPKTPFPVALKFIRQLRVGDLQKLAKNKNIASQLAKIAKELVETKRK